jgi:hypothetical protein
MLNSTEITNKNKKDSIKSETNQISRDLMDNG